MENGLPDSVIDANISEEAGELDVTLDSPVLDRLIREVQGEEEFSLSGTYNRTYNRHNR